MNEMRIDRIYIVANTTKEAALRVLSEVKSWSQQKQIKVTAVKSKGVTVEKGEEALVLALGGDGTVLRAASMFAELGIPILGANLGSLGFLTQVSASSLTDSLDQIIDGEFSVEERMRLSYACGDNVGTVLNDIVIEGTSRVRFCEIELSWRRERVASYSGDGLILSTATGSTAYALSAGGPVIVPPAACILGSPLATHRLGVRPIIFPAEETLSVNTRTETSIFVDGDHLTDLPPKSKLSVKKAPSPTNLIRMHGAPSFFELLQEKLNWGDSKGDRKTAWH